MLLDTSGLLCYHHRDEHDHETAYCRSDLTRPILYVMQ